MALYSDHFMNGTDYIPKRSVFSSVSVSVTAGTNRRRFHLQIGKVLEGSTPVLLFHRTGGNMVVRECHHSS